MKVNPVPILLKTSILLLGLFVFGTGALTGQADLSGSLVVQSHAEASGGQYVRMEGDGVITWPDVEVSRDGDFTLRIGYYLPFDVKTQYVNVNGTRTDTVVFPTPLTTWRYVDRDVSLVEGSNSISIEHFWGWMWFDYIEILGDDDPVSVEKPDELPIAHSHGLNYPNPFNPATNIPYTLGCDDPFQSRG